MWRQSAILFPPIECGTRPRAVRWRPLPQDFILFVLISAVLLPICAPIFDHHYAERHLHHQHIYLGPTVDHHHHGLNGHHHGLDGHHNPAQSTSAAASDVISVPSAGDWQPTRTLAGAVLLSQALDDLLPTMSESYNRLSPAALYQVRRLFLKPPHEPPRS